MFVFDGLEGLKNRFLRQIFDISMFFAFTYVFLFIF